MENNILGAVNDYYTQKIKEFGNTPRGVDWNSSESQQLRFTQLCKVIDPNDSFSLLDFGCGYGAMLGHLAQNNTNFQYTGFDISDEMIAHALKSTTGNDDTNWVTKLPENKVYDYTVASGIFNVRLNISDNDWEGYILDTLNTLNKHSTKGFSFNMLTSYSDKEFMRDYLYYANPVFFFDYCKKNFSKYIALLHDYPLYEFTIIVKKLI